MNASGHPGKPWRNSKLSLDLAFILYAMLLALVFFSMLRVLLYVRNLVFAEGIPATELLTSFLIGVRFDLIAVCIGVLPLVLMLLLKRSHGQRRIAMVWFSFYCAICLFLGIVELEFYHEFQTRLNNLAAQYLKEDPVTVLRMLWYGFPVLKYLALWTLLVTLFVWFLRAINIRTTDEDAKTGRFSARLAAFVVMLILVVTGARGTLRSGPPLRWGDAYHSQHLFANHLPLNATYTFVKALRARGHQQKANKWLTVLDEGTALQVTRDLLSAPGDTQIEDIEYPIERIHSARVGTGVKNVVLILMESFSAEFVGALGKDKNITPYFNELAKRGILFNHFFSNGTHTHQGMFASVACFPNLPGYEYLMQEPQGQNQFSGLPVLLGEEYNDVYVYNGEFSWDNQEGFFRNQGVTSFFGRNDYVDPKFIDPTWGVSDEDMFDQALIELDRLAHQDKPFYAILQTLSNHVPYALPDELPFKPVTQHGRLNDHLTAQKYSDWALGQFFNAVEKTDYYEETLFVLVGDHGFGLDERKMRDMTRKLKGYIQTALLALTRNHTGVSVIE